MAIFQNTVVNKYLNNQNEHVLSEKWNIYKTHFFDPKVQENIRDSKEEEYQEGFMRDLFVNVLGYTLKPKDNYNLVLEKKNVKDSKKADAAIAIDNKIFGVIELKGTYVTDLSSVETQAFGYKVNHTKDCIYVITSNFEKLRFYIDNTIDHIEFNLFTLTEQEFKLLYLCLAFENVKNQIPKKLKEGSLSQEEEITKQLYKDYSLFKRELFQDLTKQNPQFEPLELFKKSQKLLDRFLFLFFAEDRNLLPPNSVRLILTQWKQLKDLDAYSPLYERFKKYFGYLNTGFKGKQYDIFAYNGGLFKPDEVLANIVIDDELLYKHTLKLADYDFVSEVDVNILGHIFENSLNELDEVKTQLEGTAIDKSTTKRKKDGVFYTPKYITKYIVENTVGKLCEEKKTALSIIETDYFTDKKRQKKTIKPLVEKLKQYRDWLLQLTICDPACGSGAFLNEALNFLITEHGYIDELEAKLFGDAMVLSDVENSILENNLFGVDLNEESVEIAKLSLWLRTAQPNRKLNNLNNNIKCGNSLIDEPEIAGDKAFHWESEFPAVFEKGGFDVVIGNPPYVRKQGLMEHYPEMCVYYESKYVSATANYDLYALFMEASYKLINNKGIVSFILPHKFLISDFGEGIRTFFKENTAVENLVHFGSELVFKDAATYTCIVDLTKTSKENVKFKKVNPTNLHEPFVWDTMSYSNLCSSNWDLQSESVFEVIEKFKQQPFKVDDVFDKIFQGIATSLDAVYVFKGEDKGSFIKGYNEKFDYHFEIEKEMVNPVFGGRDIFKYQTPEINNYVIFPYHLNNHEAKPMQEDYISKNLPKAYSYLKHFEKEIKGRERGRMNIDKGWFLYIYPKNLPYFQNPKIMTREISLGCNMTYDEKGDNYHNTKVYSFIKNKQFDVDEKYYLGILNSKVMWFFLKNTGSEYGGGYYVFKTNYLKPFPLPEISENSDLMIDNVNQILSSNKNLQEVSSKFQRTLKREFEILEKLPKKLENWYELTFADFIMELKKKKIVLSFEEEGKWEDYFLPEQQKALEIKAQITKTDKEIDAMVYELYDLTDEEIAIVENS
jgi:type I restriction-modification system DNA methylase subunit